VAGIGPCVYCWHLFRRVGVQRLLLVEAMCQSIGVAEPPPLFREILPLGVAACRATPTSIRRKAC
jgi:hypothetical protein